MKKIYFLLFTSISILQTAKAQDETDALRYSFLTTGSTARGQAIGGALGSIGADFGGLSVNPATIGRYSKNEFSFTPSYKSANTPTAYLGTNATNAITDRLNFDNAGLILAKRNRNRKKGWLNSGFGIGVNRLADFNRNYTYTGVNKNSSLIDALAEEVNNNGGYSNVQNTNDLATHASKVYLLNPNSTDSTKAVSIVPIGVNGIQQTKTVTQSGGINEMVLSLGGNYSDQFMIGATLGIPFINYNRNTIYTENDLSGNANNDFKSLSATEALNTSGAGINLKIGAIYTPSQYLRFGLALHTPTKYSLTDIYTNNMTSDLENYAAAPGIHSTSNTGNVYSYSLTTPARAIFSGSFIIGKSGFITADYEMVNYQNSKFDFGINDQAYQAIVQSAIATTYRNAGNIKLGGEARFKNISIRGGIAHYGNPYSSGAVDGSLLKLSLGIGFRAKAFFTDLTFVNTQEKQSDYAYVYNATPTLPATVNYNSNNVIATIGWKF